jgi:hypothetical protein
MKTAMQELMDWFYNRPEYDKTSEGYEIMTMCEILLNVEKEQIIDFHVMLMKNGLEQEGNIIEWDYNELKQQALEFYNQTYNQNK